MPRQPWRVNCTDTRLDFPVLYALLAIVVVAPFERPLLVTPGGFTLTTVESAVMLASALIIVGFGLRRLIAGGPIPLAIVGGVFLLALLVAALAAPAERGNALRFVGRMVVAAALFVIAVRVISTRREARIVAYTMLGMSAFVAAVAVLESAQVRGVMNALTIFRPGFHVVGGQLRATSTLFYPTITSMYPEILAGAGSVGFLALVALVAAAGAQLWSRAQQARDEHHVATLAGLAVWTMVVGHGMVDSFLSFSTTYVTFAIAAGVAFSPGLIAPFDFGQGQPFDVAQAVDRNAHRL